jgi:hypothetical protein
MFSTYKDESGNNIYPELDDYKLYIEVKRQNERTEQETIFIKVAEKRMSQMKNNPEYIRLIEQAEDEFDFEAEPLEIKKEVSDKGKFVTPKDAHLLF